MSIIELRDLHYTYRSRYRSLEALRGISCSFEAGKFYAIMGRSGSGKTTLLSLMAGLDLPGQGEVLYEGVSTAELDLERYRREQVAVVYQNFRLLPLLTAAENVMLPMELQGERPRAARRRALELLERMSLPGSVGNAYPPMLSGGEQQRVAIARALGTGAKLLLADEPTGNLDTANGEAIVDILAGLAHREGYCVLVTTHSPTVARQADTVRYLQDGVLAPER